MKQPLGTGVIIPVCTPLNVSDEVDEDSLRRLLDHLIDHGVHGVFVLGTTGEFGFLTDAQRALVVATAVEHVAGRVPVLVGVSDMASERAIDQARALLPLGADAAVATAPFFAATGPMEMAEHFRRIKAAIGSTPLFGYENPPRVNDTSIPAQLVLDLAEEGTFTGFKDSSGDPEYLAELLRGREERGLETFRVLSGSETHAVDALRAGADGLVPGLGNVFPAEYVELCATAVSHASQADDLQERLRKLFTMVGIPTKETMGGSSRALGAFKAALRMRGVIEDDRCAPPSVIYSDEDRTEIAALLAAHGVSIEPEGSAEAARRSGRPSTLTS